MTGMAIKVRGAPATRFPTVPDGAGAILVVLGNQDPSAGEVEYEITTNVGYGLPSHTVVAIVGLVLHQAGHALLSDQGELVDLTDLADPDAAAPGRDDSTDDPRPGVRA